jgi:hypothetical protein
VRKISLPKPSNRSMSVHKLHLIRRKCHYSNDETEFEGIIIISGIEKMHDRKSSVHYKCHAKNRSVKAVP